MSRLDNLLNPEQDEERAWRQYNVAPLALPGPSSTPSTSANYQLLAAPAYAYDLSHQPHAGCPNSLRCLWDTNDRPLNMPEALVQCAIVGSPERRLTEGDILEALQSKYPYYRSTHAAFALQTSVRTVLTQMPFFARVPPPVSAGGGVAANSEDPYWTVDLSAVAYGRNSYSAPLRYPNGGTEYFTGESSNHTLTADSLSALNGSTSTPASTFRAGAPSIVAGSLAYAFPHSDHPGCPNALTCLQDSDERPGYTLRTVITCAILGSPGQRLTLRDIFLYVKAKYPYFKVQNKTFEQSTRHMMSMDNTFQRVPRQSNEPGFGSFWTVDLNAQPGTKRPRWRAPRIPIPPEEQVKQGRGRPRMYLPLPKSQGGKVQKQRERTGASTVSAASGAPGHEFGVSSGSAAYPADIPYPPDFDGAAHDFEDAASTQSFQDTDDDQSYPEGYFNKAVNSAGVHEVHENCPSSLRCLDDTDERPKYTYALLLRCAILGSPEGQLTQREIFADVKAKFPYFRTANAATWQGSMRHQLSLNRLFELEDRPVSLPGQGGYWRVNLSAPPGTKRPRKRGPQDNKVATPEIIPDAPTVLANDRQRGRPRIVAATDQHSWATQGILGPNTIGYAESYGHAAGVGEYRVDDASSTRWRAFNEGESSGSAQYAGGPADIPDSDVFPSTSRYEHPSNVHR